MPEHVDLTDPELHEPKGVAAATSGQVYVADGGGSGSWSNPEPKGISGATDGQVYVANGAGSGAWTTRGVEVYLNNVSNGANSTSCSAGVDTTVPLIGNGANNFTSGSIATGKAEFQSTFNSSNGGFIVDNLGLDVDYEMRLTIVNTGTAGPVVTAKMIMVPDKTLPTTGVIKVLSVPITCPASVEVPFILKAFGNGIEAIYVQLNSDATRNFQVNGCYLEATERRGS